MARINARPCAGLLVLAGVVAWVTGAAHAAPARYTDPVSYCRAVGTIDFPHKRYGGQDTPDWMYAAMNHPKDSGGYVAWRCVNRQVLACDNGGITGPCDKRDTSRTPTTDMRDWCQQHPNDPLLSAALVGHYTVYNWRCVGTQPRAGKTMYGKPDKRGFDPTEWVRVNR